MKISRFRVWFGLILSLACLQQGVAAHQLQSRATDEEARAVNEIVTTFMRRVQETRDFGAARDLYLADFVRLQIDAERDFLFPEQVIYYLPFGPANSLYFTLWPQISYQDWERLYFAYQNFMYLRVLYIVGNNSARDARQLRSELPSEVADLLKANQVLKEYKMIRTLEDFRNVVITFERATIMLREFLRKDPPEQRQWYKEAMAAYPAEQKQYSMGSFVYVHPEGRYGFPRRTRFFVLVTKPQWFELTLVRVDEGMKIVWARVYPFN